MKARNHFLTNELFTYLRSVQLKNVIQQLNKNGREAFNGIRQREEAEPLLANLVCLNAVFIFLLVPITGLRIVMKFNEPLNCLT